jgi:cytochrome P450
MGGAFPAHQASRDAIVGLLILEDTMTSSDTVRGSQDPAGSDGVPAIEPAWAAVPTGDPYPAYARLRESGAAHRVHIRGGFDAWAITGHEAVRSVLADARLSLDPQTAPEQVRQDICAGHPEERLSLLGRHLLSVDPPDHTRLRRVMSGALTPRRVEHVREPIRQTVDRLLAGIGPAGRADLMADYAVPVAVAVACELLGIPESDRASFIEWGRRIAIGELADPDAFDDVTQKMAEYFVPHVARLRREPGPDLLSALAQARDAGELNDYELISIAYQLYFAGHETSACMIANGLITLLLHPSQFDLILDDPEMLGPAVEELLRYEGPVKTATWRFAREPVDIGGQIIPAGAAVLPVLASGSRDPACTRDPDTFDIRRGRTQHLAFSGGFHYCMGASLARMELEIAIGSAMRRLPNLRLDVDPRQLPWRDNLMMRAVAELPVTFEPVSSEPA